MKIVDGEAAAALDLGTTTLKDLANWSHLPKLLLKAGRCSHVIPDDIPEDEREAFVEKLNGSDPTLEAPLASLDADKSPWMDKEGTVLE